MNNDYEKALRHIYENGVDEVNLRTGDICRTVICIDQVYDVGAGLASAVTTRKVNYRPAFAELLGYLRGCSSAAEFRALGTKTWDANANDNAAWLANPHRKGEDDMGFVYGAVGRNWPSSEGSSIDLLTKIYTNLKSGVDDRGEILTFWNPGEFYRGCLRPCLYEHQFSILDDTLYLNSTQRSNDWPLGNCFNRMQCYTLLALMAQITGLTPGFAYHRSVNCHIYGPQLDLVSEQLSREPLPLPTLWINPEIRTLEDVLTKMTADDFKLIGYQSHPAIKYPFSV